MSVKLSKRLNKISTFVERNARLADIGSDHGYLPIWLIENNVISCAVASEVAQGPYTRLHEAVRSHGLEDKIVTRFGSGLDILDKIDEIDTLIIAGMGGILITEILDEGKTNNKLESVKHLILQPNKDERFLRNWLINHHFYIEDEALVEDKSKFYEIISAKKNNQANRQQMTEEDMIFGLFLKEKYPVLFQKKWQMEYDKKQAIKDKISKYSKDDNTETLEKEMQKIKEALK
jgi:tRNA (adenine22-N1)-methyltransferase